MSPKNPNERRLDSNEKNELAAIRSQKQEEMRKIKSSVPNFKELEKTNSKLYYKFWELDYDVKDLTKVLNSDKVSIPLVYGMYFPNREYEEKEWPTVKLTPEQVHVLEKKKRDLERGLSMLKQKYDSALKYSDPFHEKIENLEFELSDINEMLANPDKVEKRKVYDTFHVEKFDRIKEFWYGGPVYAHFAPKGLESDIKDEWYKYENVRDYLEQLRKNLYMFTREKWSNKKDDPGTLIKYGVKGIRGSGGHLSADHLEVFIPL